MSSNGRYTRAVEAFNKRDTGAFAAHYASDAVVHDPLYPSSLVGRAAIEQDIAEMIRAFPDARFSLRSEIGVDGSAAGEFIITGTHTGPLATPSGEISATGKPMRLEGSVFSRFNGQDEVVEERRYYDVAGYVTQLGISQ